MIINQEQNKKLVRLCVFCIFVLCVKLFLVYTEQGCFCALKVSSIFPELIWPKFWFFAWNFHWQTVLVCCSFIKAEKLFWYAALHFLPNCFLNDMQMLKTNWFISHLSVGSIKFRKYLPGVCLFPTWMLGFFQRRTLDA